jgi:hypothetical protein
MTPPSTIAHWFPTRSRDGRELVYSTPDLRVMVSHAASGESFLAGRRLAVILTDAVNAARHRRISWSTM